MSEVREVRYFYLLLLYHARNEYRLSIDSALQVDLACGLRESGLIMMGVLIRILDPKKDGGWCLNSAAE